MGTIEALSIVAGELNLRGVFWNWIANLSGNFGTLGFIIIGIFVASWGLSTLIYTLRRYDDTEVTLARAE